MSLKFRLAFLYSLSVFNILVVSALSIFLFNENFRKDEFTKRLVLEGSESIQLFFSVPVPTKNVIDDLNQNASNSSHQEKIFIFDSAYNLLFSNLGSPAPSIPKRSFAIAKKEKDYVFSDGSKECALLFRPQQQKQFYVLVTGYDVYGRRKSDNLKVLLTASVFGGLLLSGFLAFFYVRHAMYPLEELKRQIEKIDEKNLKERIEVGNKNNEVWQIAKKFNAMLDRLEQAFEQRKNFVQHASHELRTPLANMLAQTEAALSKNMSAEDSRQILLSLKEDQQDMIDLTNSLLTLSRYERITSVSDWTTIRIDEILYEVVDFSKQMWPDAVVTVDFENLPENETALELLGNESLIRSAVQNIVKNAINYSTDHSVKVSIASENNGITLHFDNFGNQLSTQEQSRLFIPFFRGENSVNKKGYGLGLSIVKRIIQVHNGSVDYHLIGDRTNRFSIYLPSGK